MARVLFIIAQVDFRDEELLEPKKILESRGHICDVASITLEEAHGMLGAVVLPDLAVHDVDVNRYAAIVVVGGRGSPSLADEKDVISVLQQGKEKKILLASICLGGVVLAKAKVSNGKKATVFKTSESLRALKENGVLFVDLPLVTDDLLVTAQGPHVAREFGKRLAESLR